jgi:hypothetical protein
MTLQSHTQPEIKLTDYQLEIFNAVLNPKNRLITVVASTRAGKTFIASFIALYFAINGKKVIIIAPTYKQSQILLKNIRDLSIRFGLNLDVTRDAFKINGIEMIYILSAHDPVTLLGHGGMDLLIIDECAEIEDDTYYQYIYRMMTTANNAKMLAISTPHKLNFFHDLFNMADAKFKITVHDAIRAGIMDEKMVEIAKQKLPDQQFRCWYLAEFTDMSDNLFPLILPDELFIDINVETEIFGLDFGRTNNKTVLVGIAHNQNVENEIVVTEIHNIPLGDSTTQARFIANIVGQKPVFVDPFGMGKIFIDILRSSDINVNAIPAFENNSERENGIISVALKFRNKQIKFKSDLKIWRSEILDGFRSYGTSTKKSESGNDDVLDAIIYAVANADFSVSVGNVKFPNPNRTANLFGGIFI